MTILENKHKIENEIQELQVELKEVEGQRAQIISRIQLLQKSLTLDEFMGRDNSGDFIEKTDNSSPPEKKISLFRSYFRGREFHCGRNRSGNWSMETLSTPGAPLLAFTRFQAVLTFSVDSIRSSR